MYNYVNGLRVELTADESLAAQENLLQAAAQENHRP